MLSIQQILDITQRATNELVDPSFECIQLEKEEVKNLILSQPAIDLDYMCLKQKCSTLFSHSPIQDFFADLPCELFSRGCIQNVYSKKDRKIFSVAKVGDYLLGFVVVGSGSDSSQSDETLTALAPVQYCLDSDSYLSSAGVNEFLASQSRLLPKMLSFQALSGLLTAPFGSATIAIFRYGQKVPFAILKPKIIEFLTDCQIPLELALAQEFLLSDNFLCARYSPKVRQYAYSNFLSNDMCNVLINDELVAQAYCATCYRLSIYNTFQHFKKDVKILLERSGNISDCSLNNFGSSFNRCNNLLSELCDKIPLTKLRVEMYFSLNTLSELNIGLQSLKLIPNSFDFVKCKFDNIQTHFTVTRKLSEQLFFILKDFSDSRALYFIIFFSKLISYVFSTEKMGGAFVDTNFGVYFCENHVQANSFELLPVFFVENSFPAIFATLVNVFGCSARSKQFVSYYMCCIFDKNLVVLGRDKSVIRFLVQKIGNTFAELCSIKGDELGFPSVEQDIYTVLQALATRFKRKKFVVETIQFLLKSSSIYGEFLKQLSSYLQSVGFKLAFNSTLFILCENFTKRERLTIESLHCLSQKYSFARFDKLLCKPLSELSAEERRDLDIFNQSFTLFNTEEEFRAKEYLSVETEFVPLEKRISVEKSVFARFLFMLVPTGKNITSESIMVKLCAFFGTIDALMRYLYVSLVRYYLPEMYTMKRIYKFTSDFFSIKRQKVNSDDIDYTGMTFNRVLYFSGLFDRLHGKEGIYLPLYGKIYLRSRLGQVPHVQYTNIMDLVQGRAPTTDSSSQPKSRDILALYDAFRNAEDNNNNVGNLSFISNNLFINNVPDYSDNNSDDSIIENFAAIPNPRPPVTSVVPEPTVGIPVSLASDDMPSLPAFRTNAEPASVPLVPAIPAALPSPAAFKRALEEVLPLPSQSQFVSALISNGVTEDLLAESSVTDLTDYFVDMCGFSRITAVTVAKRLKVRFG